MDVNILFQLSDCKTYLSARILKSQSPSPAHSCVLATALVGEHNIAHILVLMRMQPEFSSLNVSPPANPSPSVRAPHFNRVTMYASVVAIILLAASAVAPAFSTPIEYAVIPLDISRAIPADSSLFLASLVPHKSLVTQVPSPCLSLAAFSTAQNVTVGLENARLRVQCP
jgi:hypothetical protein